MYSKTKHTLIALSLTGLLVGGGAAYSSVSSHMGSAGRASVIAPGIALSYPANFSDDKILLGASNNVFVGKVLAQTGNKQTQVGPRTQYSVKVIRNIKGALQGTVTVDQLGGYKDGRLVVVEDSNPDTYQLTPGSTYLFSTRFNDVENWYTMNPHPKASKRLSSDESLDERALAAVAEKDAKVSALEAAYPDEVLLGADVANDRTWNAFESLPPEAKAAAVAQSDRAKAALGGSQPSPAEVSN